MLVLLEAPRACEAAAAGVEDLEVEAHLLVELSLGGEPHDGVLVAVAVNKGLAREPRRVVGFGFVEQELGEGDGIVAQAPGILVVGSMFGSSSRKAAVQLGPTPTTLIPSRT